jgi:hypothetical protein
MFEKDLKAKMQTIFGLKKVSFDRPSPDALEQECLFIDVSNARNRVSGGEAWSRVEGQCKVFVNGEKLPFGFFTKKIRMAAADLTQDLFFYNIEDQTKIYGNIVERRFDFVYFWKGAYDPDQGELTSIVY